jgi:hypothetical protein
VVREEGSLTQVVEDESHRTGGRLARAACNVVDAHIWMFLRTLDDGDQV